MAAYTATRARNPTRPAVAGAGWGSGSIMATIRIFKHYIPTQFLLLGLLEMALLVVAFHVGMELRFHDAAPAVREHVQPLFPKALTFALVVVMTMIALGLYQRSLREGMEAMS